MAKFKVPQHIDMEDRIIGPLTLIQFSYLLIGGAVIYILFSLIKILWLFILISLPITLVALAFAFLKIQDQPFTKFLANVFLYSFRPKNRIWHRGPVVATEISKAQELKKPKEKMPPKKIEKTQLEKLARYLDAGMSPR